MSLPLRIKHLAFQAGRRLFRSLPLDPARRGRLRDRLLPAIGHWQPPPPAGIVPAGPGQPLRAFLRADEPAIGHVPPAPGVLPDPPPARLVAFYLPQFHPFPENDAWWGKGFTEWRNVTRALPQFEGHRQPRLPADLGFYDLRNPQVMRDQARLAADHGISAFCFYFYWFGGKTLMEEPLRQWLADPSIDLSFCLCWANENWSRRWDGREDDVLIAQQHGAADDLAFIAHVAAYLRDPRALKVDGRPVLLVYRADLLPDAAATAGRWRQWCLDNGIGPIHLACVHGFTHPDPRTIGFDAAVEFPPNLCSPPVVSARQYLLNPDFGGDVRDWRTMAAEMAARPLPDYPLHPGVNPAWDNEPRRSGRGRVYLHASPRGYRDWLAATVHGRLRDVPPGRRLVFLNAWNEWAEGAVLEPDQHLGHAWLQATRAALQPPAGPAPRQRPCAVLTGTDAGRLVPLLDRLAATGLPWRVVLPSPAPGRSLPSLPPGNRDLAVEVLPLPADFPPLAAFLHAASRLLDGGTGLVLHLQDTPAAGPEASLLAPDSLHAALDAFHTRPTLGAVVPQGCLSAPPAPEDTDPLAARLAVQCGLYAPDPAAPRLRGSQGWFRLSALRPVLDAHLPPSLLAGGAAAALEGLLPAAIAHAGGTVVDTSALAGGPGT